MSLVNALNIETIQKLVVAYLVKLSLKGRKMVWDKEEILLNNFVFLFPKVILPMIA